LVLPSIEFRGHSGTSCRQQQWRIMLVITILALGDDLLLLILCKAAWLING